MNSTADDSKHKRNFNFEKAMPGDYAPNYNCQKEKALIKI